MSSPEEIKAAEELVTSLGDKVRELKVGGDKAAIGRCFCSCFGYGVCVFSFFFSV